MTGNKILARINIEKIVNDKNLSFSDITDRKIADQFSKYFTYNDYCYQNN